MTNIYENKLSVDEVRAHIPLLNEYIYVDNGTTTPVPIPVIEAMDEYFLNYCTNVGRGGYDLAVEATKKFDLAREDAANLLLNLKWRNLFLSTKIGRTK